MRIALFSDLHLEGSDWTPPPLDVDGVVLAGDIANNRLGLHWASRTFPDLPVIYVSGNHEFYHTHIETFQKYPMPSLPNVHFLECATHVFDEVRFLGCTLWSSFELRGRENAQDYMLAAQESIADYSTITGAHGKRLTPAETRKLHRQSVTWLQRELAKPFDGKTVVVTHFAPHPICVAPEHFNSDVSPYFVNDLHRLIDRFPIALWCFGHTHTNVDYTTASGCRIISNQRGYSREEWKIGFRPEWVIEV
jgi:predicted phosphodiesterase